MNYGEYIDKASTVVVLSLAFSGCAVSFAGAAQTTDPDKVGDSAKTEVAPPEQGQNTAPSPAIPVLAQIRVDFMLDPRLTRSLSMGDRWVSPPTFTNARQPGKRGTVKARAVGLDYRGRLLNRRLEPEWLAADPAQVTVSPTRGNRVTITMQSPGESTLNVNHGDVSETLTLKATYDEQNNMTQLVISRVAPDQPRPSISAGSDPF